VSIYFLGYLIWTTVVLSRDLKLVNANIPTGSVPKPRKVVPVLRTTFLNQRPITWFDPSWENPGSSCSIEPPRHLPHPWIFGEAMPPIEASAVIVIVCAESLSPKAPHRLQLIRWNAYFLLSVNLRNSARSYLDPRISKEPVLPYQCPSIVFR
jgi:hypothetical protein